MKIHRCTNVEVEIAAPVPFVWQLLTDVENYSKWTPTIQSVTKISPVPFSVGAQYRVRQPGVRDTIYTVTRIDASHDSPGKQASPARG